MRSPGPFPPDHPDAPFSTSHEALPPTAPPAESWLWPLAKAVDAAFAEGDTEPNALLRVALSDDDEPDGGDGDVPAAAVAAPQGHAARGQRAPGQRPGGGDGPAAASQRSVLVPGDEFDLGLRPLGDDHPLDLLLGFVAPDDWLAIGVTCRGRARSLDPGTATPPGRDPKTAPTGGTHTPSDVDAGGDPDAGASPGDHLEGAPRRGTHAASDTPTRDDAEPVSVTLLLSRSGAAAAFVRRDGRRTRLAEPPEGAVADACRRALRLPTAPPPGDTAELWTLWWLDRLVMTAVEPGSAGLLAGWAQVAALHPAAWLPVADHRHPTDHSDNDPRSPDGPAPDLGQPRSPDDPPGHGPARGFAPAAAESGPWPHHPQVGPEPDVPTAAGFDGGQRTHRPQVGPEPDVPTAAGFDGGQRTHRPHVGPEPDVLAAAAQALADAWPWTRLRTDPGAPDIPGASPGPEVAAWMDDGMYARWMLSSFPSCRDLLDAVAAVLPRGLAQRVKAVVGGTLADATPS